MQTADPGSFTCYSAASLSRVWREIWLMWDWAASEMGMKMDVVPSARGHCTQPACAPWSCGDRQCQEGLGRAGSAPSSPSRGALACGDAMETCPFPIAGSPLRACPANEGPDLFGLRVGGPGRCQEKPVEGSLGWPLTGAGVLRVESGKGIHQVSHQRASWAAVRHACCLSSTLSPCACAARVPLKRYCCRTETCPQAASCEWSLLEWRGGGRFLS